MGEKENIGLYPGSFNPFHLGHYNILQKAESIFDRVVIAYGQNKEKMEDGYVLPTPPEKIKNREIRLYSGLLTDFIYSLPYEITVIRGLRNSTDLQYELTQYRFLQEMMPKIKVVSIFCDKEYEHISSSAIRMLQKYGKGKEYLL